MKSRSGFTIVELLIVIVVIGILAAIAIVAYRGVQQRALTSALVAETNSVAKKLELFKVTNDAYPSSISACPTPAADELCLQFSGDRQIDYQRHESSGSGYEVINTHSYSLGIKADDQFVYTSSAEKTATGEFMRYVDLAPYIDKYGLKKYQLSFEAKSADTSSNNKIRAYFQNGSTSRYGGLNQEVSVTTEYQKYTLQWTATNVNLSTPESWLAFYGTYDTGNRPIVKNVQVSLAP